MTATILFSVVVLGQICSLLSRILAWGLEMESLSLFIDYQNFHSFLSKKFENVSHVSVNYFELVKFICEPLLLIVVASDENFKA